MIDLLKELCSINAVSGNEFKIRHYILGHLSKNDLDISEDVMGNIIVFKRGKKRTDKKVMICAHMDEVGFIIKNITEAGVLKFGFVGGIDPRVVIGSRVIIGDNGIRGIIGIKAVHLTTKQERAVMPKVSDLYIDIGASCKEDALKMVSIGEYASFDSRPIEFGDGLIKAKAIDDRLGCAIILKLIESEIEHDVYFCFNTQEEVGLRGAATCSFSVNPDICLVIESTTAADIPGVKGNKMVCRLRHGAVIPFMDGGTIYDGDLYEFCKNLAINNSIKCQTKTLISGGTDAGRIHLSGSYGVKTCAVSAPVRYLHSASSVGSIQDMYCVYNLVKLFIHNLGEII